MCSQVALADTEAALDPSNYDDKICSICGETIESSVEVGDKPITVEVIREVKIKIPDDVEAGATIEVNVNGGRYDIKVPEGKKGGDPLNALIPTKVEISKTGKLKRVLACGHSFHDHCVEQWLKKSATCPVCRKEEPGYVQSLSHDEAMAILSEEQRRAEEIRKVEEQHAFERNRCTAGASTIACISLIIFCFIFFAIWWSQKESAENEPASTDSGGMSRRVLRQLHSTVQHLWQQR